MSFSSRISSGNKKIPDVDGTMYSVDSSSSMFHDYSTRAQPIPSADHALQSDLFVYPTSPNSLTMYEQDGIGGGGGTDICTLSSSIPSTCGDQMSELGCDDFELKPQFETNIDSLLHFDLEMNTPPLQEPTTGNNAGSVNDTGWSTNNSNFLKMEDVFQVEQNDVRGPTLAELNAEDSISIFGDIESIITKDLAVMGNLCQPALPNPMEQPVSPYATCTVTSPTVRPVDTPVPNNNSNTKFSPKLSPSVYSGFGKLSLISPETKLTPILPTTVTSPSVSLQHGYDNSIKNTLQTLLLEGQIKQEKPVVVAPVSSLACPPPLPPPPPPPPAATTIKPKQISPVPTMSPAVQAVQPTVQQAAIVSPAGVKRMLSPDEDEYSKSSMDKKWEEIKQFIQDHEQQHKKQLLEIGSPPKQQKLDVKDIAFTPPDDVESNDEASDISDAGESDDEQDMGQFYEESFWSDNESNDSVADDLATGGKKERRFFWQYNTQSKGPKGKRLCKTMQTRDPHVLDDFEDPVFDPDLNQSQYKHNGKARRGDGNDITPNPQKFFQIGNELRKLNRTINNLTPVNELPVNVRSKSRKEKNKLASRACRLKKKAQHEANKVKLHGLNKEHQLLMMVIDGVKDEVFERIDCKDKNDGESLSTKFDSLVKKHLTHMIAGHTTEYVNSVLTRVAGGDPAGGLN